MPGRALPAAQPHTEFTTSISVPGVFFTASSTAAAVLSSFAPMAVISPRIGAISISGYGMFESPSADLRGPRLLRELGVAFGFEFVPWLPGRQGAGVGDAVTDGDEELRVVDRAAQVPVRTDFV